MQALWTKKWTLLIWNYAWKVLVCACGFSRRREKAGSSIKKRKVNDLVSQKINVIPLKIKIHRRGKRNSIKLVSKTFSWLGNNIAGAKSKWASIQRLVRIKSPSILSLQETKFQVFGKHITGSSIEKNLASSQTLVHILTVLKQV